MPTTKTNTSAKLPQTPNKIVLVLVLFSGLSLSIGKGLVEVCKMNMLLSLK